MFHSHCGIYIAISSSDIITEDTMEMSSDGPPSVASALPVTEDKTDTGVHDPSNVPNALPVTEDKTDTGVHDSSSVQLGTSPASTLSPEDSRETASSTESKRDKRHSSKKKAQTAYRRLEHEREIIIGGS